MKTIGIRTKPQYYKPLNAQTFSVITLCRDLKLPADRMIWTIRTLTNCTYQNEEKAVTMQNGIILSGNGDLKCFNEPDIEYIDVEKWQTTEYDSLGDVWTADFTDAPDQQLQSVICPGTIDFQFSWVSSVLQAQNQIQQFLNAVPHARRIREAPEDRRGRAVYTRHISIRC
jgi:hypothetical protein